VTLQLGKDPGSSDKYFKAYLAVFTAKKIHPPPTLTSCPLLGTYTLIWRRLASTSVWKLLRVCRIGICVEQKLIAYLIVSITFRVSRRRREMYCGHVRLCLSTAACPNYWTDPDVILGNGMGCPLVVHYWEDSQSVHGLRYYGSITRTRNVSECLALACLYSLYAWLILYLYCIDHWWAYQQLSLGLSTILPLVWYPFAYIRYQ